MFQETFTLVIPATVKIALTNLCFVSTYHGKTANRRTWWAHVRFQNYRPERLKNIASLSLTLTRLAGPCVTVGLCSLMCSLNVFVSRSCLLKYYITLMIKMIPVYMSITMFKLVDYDESMHWNRMDFEAKKITNQNTWTELVKQNKKSHLKIKLDLERDWNAS